MRVRDDGPRVPYIRGALVAGPAAYALSRVLDRQEIAERLAAAGYGERWRELALAAVEAIDEEAAVWGADARQRLAREHAASASGTTARKRSAEVSSSAAMSETITTRQAAEDIGVSTRAVRAMAASGRLPGRRTPRGDWALEPGAVAALARERRGPRGSAATATPGRGTRPALSSNLHEEN